MSDMRKATDNQHLRAMYYRALWLQGPAANILLPLLRDLLPEEDRKYAEEEMKKKDPNRFMKRYPSLIEGD